MAARRKTRALQAQRRWQILAGGGEAKPPSADDLAEQAKNMSHVSVKTHSGDGPDAESVAAMGKIWTDNGGDVDKVSAASGGCWRASAIKANMPSDAKDFGTKALSGAYSED